MSKKISPVIDFDHGAGGSLEILAEFNLSLKEGERKKRVLLICVTYGKEDPPEHDEILAMMPGQFTKLLKAKTLKTFSRILTDGRLPLEQYCSLCSVDLDQLDKLAIRKGHKEEIDAAEAVIAGEPVCEECSKLFDEDIHQEEKKELMLDRIQELGQELRRLRENEACDADRDEDDGAEHI